MIISEELASTPLMVTSEPSSPAFSAMMAAGRAWRPTAEPTTTDLLGMVLLRVWGGSGVGLEGGGAGDGAQTVATSASRLPMLLSAMTAKAPTTTPATSAIR